jgi:cell shape-determining protein MreD
LSKVNSIVTFVCLPKCLLRNSRVWDNCFSFVSSTFFFLFFYFLSFSLCFPQHPSKSAAASSEVAEYVLLSFIWQCFIVRKILIRYGLLRLSNPWTVNYWLQGEEKANIIKKGTPC